MARSISKAPKRGKISRKVQPLMGMDERNTQPIRRDDKQLTPLNDAQAVYINSIQTNNISFGIGPAGTGKTFIAASMAAEALLIGEVDRIIITRPAVDAGEHLGFMPGDINEKYDHYLTPLIEVLTKRLGSGPVEMYRKNGKIEALPLAFMRGRNLENAFIILDEAQNTTPSQMKMFLTRFSEGSIGVIDGDCSQTDIDGPSGLVDALRRLRGVRGIGGALFTKNDVVRSGLVADILACYEDDIDSEAQRVIERFFF